MSLMSWGMDAKSIADTPQGGLLDDVWDAADLQVRNLDRALFAVCVYVMEYSFLKSTGRSFFC